ncbi:MAG: hypothetical protein Q9163_003063 [Psora crenata]
MSVPPEEIAYQKAHASDYNAQGLNAFCIVGMCVVTVGVALRLWSRKMQKIAWQSDDYTLIVALVRKRQPAQPRQSISCMTLSSSPKSSPSSFFGGRYVDVYVCMDVLALFMGENGGQRLTRYVLPSPHLWACVGGRAKKNQTDYAYNIIYTVAYPLSRISLVLLYRRIFVQQWFRIICWIFVGIFSGYAISTAIVDVWLTIPINAYWDKTIIPKQKVDEVQLYIANAAFNISTDCILLLLPLTIIWRLNMTSLHKVGLSAIFCLGTLTLVASIVRLVLFFRVNPYDTSYTLTSLGFWTAAEQFLGILCPCLVTFGPLIRSGYLIFSSSSSLGRGRGGLGGRPGDVLKCDHEMRHGNGGGGDGNKTSVHWPLVQQQEDNGSRAAKTPPLSSHSNNSKQHGTPWDPSASYPLTDLHPVPPPVVPSSAHGTNAKDGMVVNQQVALRLGHAG